MIILALDLAERTGWCVGEVGRLSVSGSRRFAPKGAPLQDMITAASIWVRDTIAECGVTMIVRETPLLPRWSGFSNVNAFVSQHYLHGAIVAQAGIARVADVDVPVETWRKHFCGKSTANPRAKKGVKKTSSEKTADRKANKAMAIERARLLGYIPPDCEDTDRADACGLYDYAAATYGRAVPEKLVMFG